MILKTIIFQDHILGFPAPPTQPPPP